tara:strand:+ start:1980 stop:3038 length:1059 start_codon:yes stop_codon:yes gene_type:complete
MNVTTDLPALRLAERFPVLRGGHHFAKLPAMKFSFLSFSLCLLATVALADKEDRSGKSSDPFDAADAVIEKTALPDPFGDLEDFKIAPEYTMEVDRSRGTVFLDAADGQYQGGSHFANWFWKMNSNRSGNYFVALSYDSSRPKLGVQFKVGSEAVLKGYAPRTNPLSNEEPMVLGTTYLEEPGDYPVALLTGDQSNVPSFQVKGVHFIPAPESNLLGQSIDGTIQLDANTATTYSENMRYEPKPEKNCLGYWTNEKDWAEWVFDVSTPGEFDLTLHYGCGNGNEGSEVAVLVNDQVFKFTVDDTGGFQSWKQHDLGKVTLTTTGENKLAIIPLTKKGKSVMDISKVSLTPTS